MARGRIASPEEEEEEHDHQEEPSRKKQRTANGKSSAKASAANDSDSDGVLSEDEEATAAALRGWTIETFTDKPVQATKPVLQQVSLVYWEIAASLIATTLQLKKAQEVFQSQIKTMENSIGKIQDVACALEDCRWGLPAKSSSKSKAAPQKSKVKGQGRMSEGEDEEQDDQEGSADVDDAAEKRNEDVGALASG
jgi:hypothetical protein